ncbi:MAG: hypothetical protein A2365_03435 [Candidatus Nealsonbacteria bacterium RIFOXYB1_FULL_40_15]|uniref:Nucleotidyl transferase AbiEii/AbiGii toxin family protein n=2 Tax=Candidatus Nealsoniibacteriota TaxID=1817911 RepID=A0A1G2ERJ7_9BACT|nr:MAG: hypothetical protein A2365_03435 [Candidatus Nealsonbacteria bacterium RIFOXYB1_FULL_40_15]OGZ28357.1 MAG: hypothetical protein A2427_01115 [Candidatus Nealsonbacteria bacterium RIFOXYC1_FULL_40_7]OGZ29482.1 MAG: hypothetical protein A2562_02210 [Candidatus Nealsonbacteria bacterium RIFOXYD1_FULL_39_11]
MQEKALEAKTKHVWEKIAESECLNDFYLAGGTGLALQFGHRKSIDLDFFNPAPFSTAKLTERLSALGDLKINSKTEEDTLNCSLNGVLVSFFKYPYKLLFPLAEYKGVKIADFRDIACMKIDVISSRGSKKDFVDLYFILNKISLKELLTLFDKKYEGIKYNRMHLLKSLFYFDEAEKDPVPVMLEDIKWEDVKERIKRETAEYLKDND